MEKTASCAWVESVYSRLTAANPGCGFWASGTKGVEPVSLQRTTIVNLTSKIFFEMASIGAWHFSPLVTDFATNVLPNVAFYHATNGSWDYQIQLAWPLNWTFLAESSTVETM
jgi:hypothetical protein